MIKIYNNIFYFINNIQKYSKISFFFKIFVNFSKKYFEKIVTNYSDCLVNILIFNNYSKIQNKLVKIYFTHFKKMFQCETCLNSFANQSKLRRHINETHLNIKAFLCLTGLMICHSENPKPRKCDFLNCQMSFAHKHHLERHIKIIHDRFTFIC